VRLLRRPLPLQPLRARYAVGEGRQCARRFRGWPLHRFLGSHRGSWFGLPPRRVVMGASTPPGSRSSIEGRVRSVLAAAERNRGGPRAAFAGERLQGTGPVLCPAAGLALRCHGGGAAPGLRFRTGSRYRDAAWTASAPLWCGPSRRGEGTLGGTPRRLQPCPPRARASLQPFNGLSRRRPAASRRIAKESRPGRAWPLGRGGSDPGDRGRRLVDCRGSRVRHFSSEGAGFR